MKAEENPCFEAIRDVHVMYIKKEITLLDGLKKELGEDFAEVVEKVNSTAVCKNYLAAVTGKGSIVDFIKFLWEPLRTKGYEFTVSKKDEGVQIHCTACPWATMYKKLGGAEWGHRLYCTVDEDLVKGFNPKIGFKRTKTLMDGDDCCDHFYYMKESEN